MNPFTGFVVFIVIWWLVLFLVLPFGVRQPDEVKEGHQDGAPENPRLVRKALITTGITVILFSIFWLVEFFGLFSFRDLVD